MKNLTIAVWLICLALGASAQQKTLAIEKVKKGEEPKAVIDAVNKEFPQSITKDLSFLPAELYGQEWNVNVTGDEFEKSVLYQVQIKHGNTDYTAVYDKDGKLLSSKQLIHRAKLPAEVMATIKKFTGWHIDDTHELIKYNGNKTITDTYKVKLEKGVEHKIVFLDPKGNIINTRFAFI
jgi:hypothetical protein